MGKGVKGRRGGNGAVVVFGVLGMYECIYIYIYTHKDDSVILQAIARALRKSGLGGGRRYPPPAGSPYLPPPLSRGGRGREPARLPRRGWASPRPIHHPGGPGIPPSPWHPNQECEGSHSSGRGGPSKPTHPTRRPPRLRSHPRRAEGQSPDKGDQH